MNQTLQADILILGAGIGGYEAYYTLAKQLKRAGIKKNITVVDHHNYFTFTPMLHEVATGSVEPSHCAIPVRGLISPDHTFLRADVQTIDPEKKEVKTDAGIIKYEYCVVALGSKINFFNTSGAEKFAHHVRTLPAAVHLQQAIVTALENAEPEINITVVGGAFTGVEIAGQFSHFIKTDIKKLYPYKKVMLTLIQAGPEIVPTMPEKIRRYIAARLTAENVTILYNSRVTEVKEKMLVFDNGKTVPSDITTWTAGFENVGATFMSEAFCERGRIPVGERLHHTKFDTLYAVGDIMCGMDQKTKTPFPQLGEAAYKEGKYVGYDIVQRIKNKKRARIFSFKSKATIIPLGNWQGVAMFGPITFYGAFAWWLRRTAYLMAVPGMVRKIKIVFDWTLHSFSHRYIIDLDN